jgi:putative DNA primase/helicase
MTTMLSSPVNSLLEVALHHYDEGRTVLAIAKSKAPYKEGWNSWFERSQTRAEVEAEFSNGAYGIGLLTAPASPFVVLDFDGPHAQASWDATGIDLPATARNITPSGGVHLIFRLGNVEGLSRKVRLVKANCVCAPKSCGIDFLINGYFIIPPTPGYAEDPEAPFDSISRIPESVIELVARDKESTPRAAKNHNGQIRDGERNATLTSLAGTMRRRGMTFESIGAALKEENSGRCEPALDEREVEAIARSVSKYEPTVEPEHLTDVGNGKRFAKQHQAKLHYSFERDQWLVETGQGWSWDNMGAAMAFAKQTSLSFYEDSANEKDNDDRRHALANHAVKSESDARLKAMLSQAKSEDGIPVILGDLDQQPYLLNCPNGVVDLLTGQFKKYDSALLITQRSSIEFDPEARCDRFLSFLDQVLNGHISLIEFAQLFFGYCLTGDVSEHVAALLVGEGANGKSTLLQILLYVLGDYASMAAPGLLMAKKMEQHPTEVADLHGKRLVCTVEVQEGKRFNEALFKWLAGGDQLKARRMREDFFDFTPSHKFVIACNHKPFVSDFTEAFWRRIRIIPFDVTIPKEAQDRNLIDKLKDEARGILAWLVSGCVKWVNDGLPEPEEVKAATRGYREEQDVIKAFIDECCEVKTERDEEQVGTVYAKYKTWAEDNGERIISSKRLSAKLKEKGFMNYQATDGKYRWKGLTLKF